MELVNNYNVVSGGQNTGNRDRKVHVMVIADGASDRLRIKGKSPLMLSHTPNLNKMTEHAATGLMSTLYDDLPKGSIVAQLGLLGYDPHEYIQGGRAGFELPGGIAVSSDDLLFRANIVKFKGCMLESYNANCIKSANAQELIDFINKVTAQDFPEFELHHVSDFRNILIVRNARVVPTDIICAEPHENQGKHFDIAHLIETENPAYTAFVQRMNKYLDYVYHSVYPRNDFSIFPWSPSLYKAVPPFAEKNNFQKKACLIGNADFLGGFGRMMGMPFFKLGNGLWDTDYYGKGQCVIEKIMEGFDFIYCHINSPDEASHMNNLTHKIHSIEEIDRFIVGPILHYFENNPEQLGSVLFCPDHYTNICLQESEQDRKEAHSMDLVPFLLWNNEIRDEVTTFSEESVLAGHFAQTGLNHLDMLRVMKVNEVTKKISDK